MSLKQTVHQLDSALSGVHSHPVLPGQRRVRAPINYAESDDSDNPAPTPKPKAPAKGQPKAPAKGQPKPQLVPEPRLDSVWLPAHDGTIGAYSHNRRREQLTDHELEDIRRKALAKSRAIITFQETASIDAEHERLQMAHHHAFHVSTYADRDSLVEAAIATRTADVNRELSQPDLTPEKRTELQLKKDQQTNDAKKSPHRVRNGGIAVFVNQHVFPQATLIQKRKEYIALRLRDSIGRLLLLVTIYAPSTKAENKVFYTELLAALESVLQHPGHENAPVLLIGDFNARPNNPSSTLPHLIAALDLRDAALDSSTPNPEPTHTSSGKNKTKSRIDLALYNEAFRNTWATQCLFYKKHSPQNNRDHDAISVRFHAHTVKAVTEPRTTYTRNLTPEVQKLLDEIEVRGDDAVEQWKNFVDDMQKVQREHLRRHPHSGNKHFISKEHQQLKRIHQSLHKLHRISLKARPADLLQNFIHVGHLPPRIHSPKAQFTRLLRQLETLGQVEIDFQSKLNLPIASVRKDLQNEQSRIRQRMKHIERAHKTNRIRKAVTKFHSYFAQEPKKFWRSIRNTMNKVSPFLQSVEVNENGQTSATANSVKIKAEVKQFYERITATKGQSHRHELQAWLRNHCPVPPDNQQLQDAVQTDFTHEETEQVIAHLPNGKGVGPDEIPAELLKAISRPDIVRLFTAAANDHLNGRPIPPEWRDSIMILLHKGKGSVHQIDKYRPITLTQVAYKIYALLLQRRLDYFVEKADVLSASQQGFRCGRGTAQKLLGVYAAIAIAKEKKLPLHMLSIDLERAFPTVEHWLIEDTLTHYGVPTKLRGAIMDTLADSTARFRLPCGRTDSFNITTGVRQGDPLSATLFNIALNPLLQRLDALVRHDPDEQPSSGPHTYADDMDLLANKLDTLLDMWENTKEYCRLTNLTISKEKTTFIMNDEAFKLAPAPEVRPALASTPIATLPQNDPFRVLGVWFTMDLDWKHHETRALGQLQGALFTISKRLLDALETTDIINKMLIAMISYSMAVVCFDSKTLKSMNEKLTKSISHHGRMYGAHFQSNFVAAKLDGGLGLYDLHYIQDAQLIRTWNVVLNGPDCHAKRTLRQYEREHNESTIGVRMDQDFITWTPFLQALKRQNMRIGTTQPCPVNNATCEAVINDYRTKEQWTRTLAFLQRAGLDTLPPLALHALLTSAKQSNEDALTWPQELSSLAPDEQNELRALLAHFHPVVTTTRTRPDNFGPGRANEAPDVHVTPGLPSRINTRLHLTHTINDINFLVVCTDGSYRLNAAGDKHIASWAAVIPSVNPKNECHGVHGLVEGTQNNGRAELVAILETLKQIKPSRDSPHILIITDSESSIDCIAAWPEMQTTRRIKTPNRDVLREIHSQIDAHEQSDKQILISHFPSHTLDPATCEKKRDKVEQVKRMYGESTFLRIQKGNDTADKLAQSAATQAFEPRTRDYRRFPSPSLDNYFLTHSGTLVDTAIHPFVKTLQSKAALEALNSKRGKRAEVARLVNSPDVDKKLSFATDNSDPAHHITLSTLATVRFHAYPTIKKLRSLARSGKRGPALAAYFKVMYPDEYCPHCPGIPEDTHHMITCPNRPTRNEAAADLRKELLQLVSNERAAAKTKSTAPLEALPLLGIITPSQTHRRNAVMASLRHRKDLKALHALDDDPCLALEYGVIPTALPRCLKELGIPKPKRLARSIVTKVQNAIVAELKARRRQIAIARNQVQNYRLHALGKPVPPPQLPPPAPPPPPQPPPPPDPPPSQNPLPVPSKTHPQPPFAPTMPPQPVDPLGQGIVDVLDDAQWLTSGASPE
jgi:ribonuclease HI/exonuclease III